MDGTKYKIVGNYKNEVFYWGVDRVYGKFVAKCYFYGVSLV